MTSTTSRADTFKKNGIKFTTFASRSFLVIIISSPNYYYFFVFLQGNFMSVHAKLCVYIERPRGCFQPSAEKHTKIIFKISYEIRQ